MVLVSFLISLWCPFHDGNKTLFLMKCKLLLFHFVKDHELFRYTRRYYSYWKILLLGERSNTPAKINERFLRMTLFPTFMSSIDVFKNRMFIVLLWLEWLTHENILITLEFLLIDSFPFALQSSWFWNFKSRIHSEIKSEMIDYQQAIYVLFHRMYRWCYGQNGL